MEQKPASRAYPSTHLFIGGRWRPASNEATQPVVNPATGEEIGRVAVATRDDLDEALHAADAAFEKWRKVSAYDRCRILRRAGELLRARVDEIAAIMTLEQGKPVAEARIETELAGDLLDWFAEEGRRAYGRIIPSRDPAVEQRAILQPIGPVAAFTPWNFPINQAVRKLAGALASGCPIILKGPENTPASCAALVKALEDAGVPAGAVNLVYGVPADISSYLIAHPVIRKVTFTGSTAIGKQLAALAGSHMKPVTMELGGHGPVLVCEDADVDRAVQILAGAKFRNAGQVCVAPTRFLVHQGVRDAFLDGFTAATKAIKVGDGLEADTRMGPLAHERRPSFVGALVDEAVQAGATCLTGGRRIGNRGFFFEPTVLADVPTSARIMNEEPFGPIALVNSYADQDAMLEEANRLPYGLAAYAYTRSGSNARKLGDEIRAGMVGINHHGLALAETPFGGVGDSGYGTEGGADALNAYFVTKFVTHHQAA